MNSPRKSSATGGLVYSTNGGRACPMCRNPVVQCVCERARESEKGDGNIRVSCETKGRGGKAVTLIRGVALEAAALDTLGKQLRAACGSGGTVKNGVIELQGDHRDRVIALFAADGMKIKRADG